MHIAIYNFYLNLIDISLPLYLSHFFLNEQQKDQASLSENVRCFKTSIFKTPFAHLIHDK